MTDTTDTISENIDARSAAEVLAAVTDLTTLIPWSTLSSEQAPSAPSLLVSSAAAKPLLVKRWTSTAPSLTQIRPLDG